MDIETLKQFYVVPRADDPTYPAGIVTLYSPHDRVHEALVALISSAKRSIVIAMYGFDDDDMAAALAAALQDQHIYVQVTLDRSQAGGVHEKDLLAKYFHDQVGNSIAIGTSEKSAIMHRKMMIIDGLWLVTGSTNWSDGGETKQDNELTVTMSSARANEARTFLDIEHDHALKQMQARAAQ